MSLEEEMSNPSDEEIIRILHRRLQTAKEEKEKYRNLYKDLIIDFDIQVEKNITLTQQNKQMMENINNIKNLCNEDWEDMTVDKFQNKLLQALKGGE